jgi:hypothetical protein
VQAANQSDFRAGQLADGDERGIDARRTDERVVEEVTTVVSQVGTTGVWGRFVVPSPLSVRQDQWLVLTTGRGIELGQAKLLEPMRPENRDELVGEVVRLAGEGDFLTRQRIDRALNAGIQACNDWLLARGFSQCVLDVDVPLDGKRVYFHFLGEIDAELDRSLDRLVECFDQATGIRKFTQAVETGCGPTCGSDGSGCTSGGCQSGGCGTGGGCGTACGLKAKRRS